MKISGFLKTIQEIKQQEVDQHRRNFPLATLRREVEPLPGRADFFAAMAKSCPSDAGIIAEIKKASPSKGDICLELDIRSFVAAFTDAGARAVSVLTESKYFKGSLADLATACTATDLPVLRKDFIIHEYQIYEAKQTGASSVLLITTLLSSCQQAEYTSLARELGMEPLVEIASEWEMEQALVSGAKVVGINNRNLATLEVDTAAAGRIAAVLPTDILPVAASGIVCRRDITDGVNAGICNFLVGESIVRAKDPGAFIRSLIQDA